MQKLAAVLLLLCSGMAWADETSHRALAEELIKLTRADDSVLTWRKRFDTQAQDLVKATTEGQARLNDGQKQAVAHFDQRGSAALDEVLAPEKVHEPLVQLYIQTFSEDESRDIAVFLKTAAGQKLLGTMPALSDGLAGIVRTQVEAIRPRLNGIAQDFQAEFAHASPHPVRSVRVTPPIPPGGMADAVPEAMDAPVAQAVSTPARAGSKSKAAAPHGKKHAAGHAGKQTSSKTAAKPAKKTNAKRCKDSSRTYPHCSK
jgi:hypothetical protein